MSQRRIVAASLAIVSFLLGSRTANAQQDTAIAEQLFRDGRTLIEAGRIDEACEKFAASERLAPATGTQLNLGLCRERQGRTATAWSLYVDVEAAAHRSGDAARARFAHDHAAALAGQLKKVVIEVPTPPPGMAVRLDGTQLPPGALGTEIPLDPGDHDLLVTAPGKKPWQQAHLALGPSATTVHVRVQLDDEGGVPAAPIAVVDTIPPPATPVVEPESATGLPPRKSSGKATAGWIVGGAGVVSLGVGAYYGLTAISRKNDESNYPVGSQDRLTTYNEAKTAQTCGIIFGAVGVFALGTGVYLVVSSLTHAAPPAPTASWQVVPALGPTMRGALLQRTF